MARFVIANLVLGGLTALVAGALVAGHGLLAAAAAATATCGLPIVVGLLSSRHLPAWGVRGLRAAAGLQIVALLAVGAFLRAPVADALRAHGAWPLALAGADEAPLQHAATAVADLLHDGAPPATPASTEAAAPAVAALTTPKEVFQARAGGVVIVQVRQPAGGMMKEVMGIEEVEGHGSGFIVDGGLVVTNHHVAGDASSIRVRLKDGRVFDTVSVVLLDPQSDLAVLKVEATGVTAVPIAKAEPSVGDGAIVIGSPLGLDYTLTTGLVSQVREQSATRMLQIDAVVAPGSSGGPVFSSSGDVIGVATAMQGQGLNLAVSSTHVLAALERARAADAPAPRVLAT